MRRTLDSLSSDCANLNLSAILIHHTGKMGANGIYTGRGASAIADWASNIVTLKKESINNQDSIKVTNEKARNFAAFKPFYLQMTSNFILNPVDPNNLITDQDIMKVLKTNNGVFNSKKDFKQAIVSAFSCPEKSAAEKINDVVNKGLVTVSKGTKNKKIYKIV